LFYHLNMMNNLVGDCRNEELIEEIFGSVSEFARQVELNGDDFEYQNYKICYDKKKDIHFFYEK